MKRITPVVVLTLLFTMSAFVALAADTTVVVHPGDMQGWTIAAETGAGSGSLVDGPGAPPSGTGSLNLVTPAAADGHVAFAAVHQDTRFDEITTLQYSTYRAAGGSALAVALQLNVDYDLTDANTTWQGRLVFEPYYSETVLTGEWQTWDAMSQGRWWATGAIGAAVCPIGSPCTWAEVLGHFPDAGIHATLGAVLLKAGSNWAGFDGNADALIIGINDVDTIYDFEFDAPPPPIVTPQTKDECKNGGWQNVTRADGSPFKNQGNCIQYVNTGK